MTQKNIKMIHVYDENGKIKTSNTSFKTAEKAIKSAEFWKDNGLLIAKEITVYDSTTGETIYQYIA